MAETQYISKITLPSNNTYYIKDAQAREQISALAGGDAVILIGVSSTTITDGGSEVPTIPGKTYESITDLKRGNLVFYGTEEFVLGDDTKWHSLGSLDRLGTLAYQNSATGTVTPTGTVSQPKFTGSSSAVTITSTPNASGNYQPSGSVSGSFSGGTVSSTGKFTPAGDVTVSIKTSTNKTATVSSTSGTATYTPAGDVSAPSITITPSSTTVKNPTSTTVAKTVVAAAPTATAPSNSITYYAYNATNEKLSLYQLGYTTGASITTSDVSVLTGASATASVPTFTGTGVRLVTGNIEVPSALEGSFTGTEGNVSVSGTAQGSLTDLSFTGDKVQLAGTTEAAGTVSQPTFTGISDTVTVS